MGLVVGLLRNYDVQIARFTQLDPLTWEYTELTPYQYASNDPIANIDIDGLEGGNILKEVVVVGHIPKTAKTGTSTVSSIAGSFLKGLGSNLLGAVEGTIDAVAHLPTTLTSLADLTTIAGSTIAGASLARQARQQAQSFKAGNAQTKAVMIGAGFGEILQLFGGEVAKAGKLGKLSKVAEVGKGGKAAKGGIANSRALGIAGEQAVGVGSKTRIPSLTGTAKYRIPDQLTSTTLGEVKNVSHLSLTRQLTDFHMFSQQTGRQFILYTRPNTTFSGPLQNLINNGSIITKPIPFK